MERRAKMGTEDSDDDIPPDEEEDEAENIGPNNNNNNNNNNSSNNNDGKEVDNVKKASHEEFEEYEKNLNVFCVSSVEYLKLKKLLHNDGPAQARKDFYSFYFILFFYFYSLKKVFFIVSGVKLIM